MRPLFAYRILDDADPVPTENIEFAPDREIAQEQYIDACEAFNIPHGNLLIQRVSPRIWNFGQFPALNAVE